MVNFKWKRNFNKELDALKNTYNFRQLKECNNSLVNLSSNDYLGLARDRELLNEFYSKYSPKLSSSSSRLIDGSYPEVMKLEEELETIYENSAILFNSGFDANSSIIETFYNKIFNSYWQTKSCQYLWWYSQQWSCFYEI